MNIGGKMDDSSTKSATSQSRKPLKWIGKSAQQLGVNVTTVSTKMSFAMYPPDQPHLVISQSSWAGAFVAD